MKFFDEHGNEVKVARIIHEYIKDKATKHNRPIENIYLGVYDFQNVYIETYDLISNGDGDELGGIDLDKV